jgi:hypothetical protein
MAYYLAHSRNDFNGSASYNLFWVYKATRLSPDLPQLPLSSQFLLYTLPLAFSSTTYKAGLP